MAEADCRHIQGASGQLQRLHSGWTWPQEARHGEGGREEIDWQDRIYAFWRRSDYQEGQNRQDHRVRKGSGLKRARSEKLKSSNHSSIHIRILMLLPILKNIWTNWFRELYRLDLKAKINNFLINSNVFINDYFSLEFCLLLLLFQIYYLFINYLILY